MLPPTVRLCGAACSAASISVPALSMLLMLAPASARGQAWVPPAGAGSVTFTFQTIDNTGHVLYDGTADPTGQSTNVGLYVEGDYAITDRFSASAGIPFVLSKRWGVDPPFPIPPSDTCRCWQSGWQDFGFTARYNLANGTYALTPSVAYGVPSHAYNYVGEATVGRRLQEVRIAVDAGIRLDAISPRLSMQGRYAYAFVEKVLDIPNNRSNAALTGAFQFARRLSLRGSLLWQHTHGGLRAPIDITEELFAEHDRLLQDNNWRLGVSASYSWSRVDGFVSYVRFMGGQNTHTGGALTVGVSWPFGLR